MQLSPSFTALPRIGRATINTANTNRDGTGTIATVFTASTSSTTSPGGGSRIDKVVVKALQTTTAGMVRLYTHDGTSAALLTEIPVAPVTVGANVAAFETVVDFLGGLPIPANWSLRASTQNAESFVVTAFGGDF